MNWLVNENEIENILFQEMLYMESSHHRHAINVCFFSIFILLVLERAEVASYKPEQCQALCMGAFLHDIGKLRISQNLLCKTSKLTDKEFDSIKKHPAFGAKIIRNLERLSEDVAVIVKQHHEDWEGKGYPEGLQYQQINPLARIVSIADSFDALTSIKSYRQCFSAFEALVTMRKKIIGKYFIPYLDTFIQSFSQSISG